MDYPEREAVNRAGGNSGEEVSAISAVSQLGAISVPAA